MQARIENPVMTFPDALDALTKLHASVGDAVVSETTRYLVEMRASQIHGCAVCLDMDSRELRRAGEPDERIFTCRGVARSAVLQRC